MEEPPIDASAILVGMIVIVIVLISSTKILILDMSRNNLTV